MRKPDGKFVLALFAAGALSFLAGFAVTELMALIPCRGEGLACNIDDAIGALCRGDLGDPRTAHLRA